MLQHKQYNIAIDHVAPHPHSADRSGPFLFTPTSLLLNHSLITDLNQTRGRNGELWIKCTGGGEAGNARMHFVVNNSVVSEGNTTSAIIALDSYPPNGLYYCESQAQRYYVSIFLRNSGKLICMMITFEHSLSCTCMRE